MSVRPRVGQVHVAADAPSTNQLSDRLRAVLEVGTRLDQQDVLEVGVKKTRSGTVPVRRPRAPKAPAYIPLRDPALKLSRRPPSPGRKPNYQPPLPMEDDVPRTQEEQQALYDMVFYDASIHGTTYVNALLEEGHQKVFVEAHVADIAECLLDTRVGVGIMTCSGEDEENRRRAEVMLAVEAARKRLKMPDWPVNAAKKESWKDFCAFEALVFFSKPEALIKADLSLSRAKLRRIFGQRELCGWVDTTLMCAGIPDISCTLASLMFLKAAAQNHIDASNALSSSSLPLCDSLTLSKMLVLVEELLLSSTYSFGVHKAKAAYDASSTNPPSVGTEVERDGRLSYVWARMLHELIDDNPIDGAKGDFYSMYPQFAPGASPIGTYLAVLFAGAQRSWWKNSLVLPATLHLVNSANYAVFQNSSTWAVMTGSFGLGSCLDAGEGQERFLTSKESRPLQVMAAKTWAVSTGTVITFATRGKMGLEAVSTFASLTLPIVALATQMGLTAAAAAPVTAAGVVVVGGKLAMNKLREVNEPLANVLGNMTQTVAQEVVTPLAEEGVRTAAGMAAEQATTLANTMATTAAGVVGVDPGYVPQVNAAGVGTFVHDNTGKIATVTAMEKMTGVFQYLGTKGVHFSLKGGNFLLGAIGKNQAGPMARARAAQNGA